MFSLKAILPSIFCCLYGTSLSSIAQNWQPLPKAHFIPSTKTTQKAIWTEDTPPQYYKKATETFINKKPTFQGMVKPTNSTSFVFKKYPLSVAEEIPIGSSFPFKDVSKLNIKYLDKAHGLFCNEITDITEDKEGLIYLSSSNSIGHIQWQLI
jgi:hypothetical protein